MYGLPTGSFAYEAVRLVPAVPWLQDMARPGWDPDRAHLSEVQRQQIQRLRSQPALALAIATATPALAPADRLYTLGAVAWHRGEFEAATTHFAAVLALPEAERGEREIAALWMQARLAARLQDWQAAHRWLTQVRARVQAGAPDPLQLFISSYGEQARLALQRQEWGRAVAWYAQQAAQSGGREGVESLLLVSRRLITQPQDMAQAIGDPMVQQLLAVYLYTRAGEWFDDYPAHRIRAGHVEAVAPHVRQLLRAIRRTGLRHLAGADRLAALSYQGGDYVSARDLLRLTKGEPLARWVDAKLKLRAGQWQAGEAALAAASRAFPPDAAWHDPDSASERLAKPVCMIAAELGVLRLSRGDYLDAARQLLAAGDDYWEDLAYVAEQVLTLDELEHLVAGHPPSRVPAHPTAPERRHGQLRALAKLRQLAARRLLRAGRDTAALTLFDAPAVRRLAERYAARRQRARAATDPVEAARNWFAAALILRRDGAELLEHASWADPHRRAATPLLPWAELARVQAQRDRPPYDADVRWMAVDHLEHAAHLLPVRSQAWAAVMCRATAWLIHYDPPAGWSTYLRYLERGAWVPWGNRFGRGPSDGRSCPLPDFDKVQREQRTNALRAWWRAGRPWLLPAMLAFGLGLRWWSRRPLSPAADPRSVRRCDQ